MATFYNVTDSPADKLKKIRKYHEALRDIDPDKESSVRLPDMWDKQDVAYWRSKLRSDIGALFDEFESKSFEAARDIAVLGVYAGTRNALFKRVFELLEDGVAGKIAMPELKDVTPPAQTGLITIDNKIIRELLRPTISGAGLTYEGLAGMLKVDDSTIKRSIKKKLEPAGLVAWLRGRGWYLTDKGLQQAQIMPT